MFIGFQEALITVISQKYGPFMSILGPSYLGNPKGAKIWRTDQREVTETGFTNVMKSETLSLCQTSADKLPWSGISGTSLGTCDPEGNFW